ncbi:unknown [Plutella xylostella multiple nucleopolyhedrovirus]|uniref:Uncharacterized protein n=3 Tax=Alphabaculovirus aucalifornicae TaxID=3047383 RepID=Q0GYD7_9ABAC|nr:unknown [Plutella xylostella multiple nucleopolyhedrovirus]AEY76191.1 hypothetical protein [Autographa californica multiple nucleopolyhedrovirus]AEY76194.1 hypothetical protein [Galleria mellonella MNPV]
MKLLAVLILFYSFFMNLQAAPHHHQTDRCVLLGTRIGWNDDSSQDPNVYWKWC